MSRSASVRCRSPASCARCWTACARTSFARTTPPTATPPEPRSPELVVLVPGLGLDARVWAGVRARLTGPSIVVPLPSMGHAAVRGSDLAVERQSRRLVDALAGRRDIVLVGHSASCPVVVEAAVRTPGILGLVLVGPVTDPRADTWPRMVGQWLRTAWHEHLWEIPVLVPQYRSTGAASMLRGMDQARRYRTQEALASLSVPTLVIRGQHDRIAPAGWCAQLAGTSTSPVTTVAGAGHMVPLTHPGVIAGAVGQLRRARGVTRPGAG